MTPRTLDWLLRLRGPALARWPEQERQAALALLRRSAQARTMLADALARDDEARDAGSRADDEPALARMQRGLSAALAARQASARIAAGARFGGLAACALLGVWLGAAGIADQPALESDPLQAVSFLSPASLLAAPQP